MNRPRPDYSMRVRGIAWIPVVAVAIAAHVVATAMAVESGETRRRAREDGDRCER